MPSRVDTQLASHAAMPTFQKEPQHLPPIGHLSQGSWRPITDQSSSPSIGGSVPACAPPTVVLSTAKKALGGGCGAGQKGAQRAQDLSSFVLRRATSCTRPRHHRGWLCPAGTLTSWAVVHSPIARPPRLPYTGGVPSGTSSIGGPCSSTRTPHLSQPASQPKQDDQRCTRPLDWRAWVVEGSLMRTLNLMQIEHRIAKQMPPSHIVPSQGLSGHRSYHSLVVTALHSRQQWHCARPGRQRRPRVSP
jgi:hypothetical protein